MASPMLPKYVPYQRRVNPMVKLNPLAQVQKKITEIQTRIDELHNYRPWKKLIQEYKLAGVKFSLNDMPKVTMVRLGDISFDEDIQRQLDLKHSKKIGSNFKMQLIQTVSAILLPGTNEFHSIDGQHTVTVISSFIDSGIIDTKLNWRDVSVPVQYIETDNRAFARKAFALINGAGKKTLSKFEKHKTHVFSARLDGSSDPDDVKALVKQEIMEKYECFPVSEKSNLGRYPGTILHVDKATALPEPILEMACKWHNEYFHAYAINGGHWFLFSTLKQSFDAHKIPLDDIFLEDLAGIVQQLFAGVEEFHSAVHEAFNDWQEYTYDYKVPWNPAAIAGSLLQIYIELGGTHDTPTGLVMEFPGLAKFFGSEISSYLDTQQAA